MPTNKNALTRLKYLDDLLSDRHHYYDINDLTEKVNELLEDAGNTVSRRCIEKDINYIEYAGPFLAEIERFSSNGRHCLRYAKPGYSIFKKDLTDDEEHLLASALSLLGQFDGLPNLEGLEGLRLGLGVRESNRKIISMMRNPLENSNLLGELFTTIAHQQTICLHYHTFKDPANIKNVNLYPYLLKEYNRRWFLIAAAESDGKLLNFSLDRIDKVVPLPSHQYKAYNGDINERFEDIVGVTLKEENLVEHILFWVDDNSKDYIATKPLHDSQIQYKGDKEKQLHEKYAQLEGGLFFSIDCRDNYELIRELSSFGQSLLVLSPASIQQEVLQRFEQTVERYHKMIGR